MPLSRIRQSSGGFALPTHPDPHWRPSTRLTRLPSVRYDEDIMCTSTFFSSGLRFSCVDCGQCCTGEPGIVALTTREAIALADHLDIDFDTCRSTYLLPHGDGFRLKEKPNGDCIFFDERCTVYPVRPSQCRTYPFWFQNMRSQDAWKRTAEQCPGIGQGRLYSEKEMLAMVQEDMERSSD